MRLPSADDAGRRDALASRDGLRRRRDQGLLELEIFREVEGNECVVLAELREADCGDLAV